MPIGIIINALCIFVGGFIGLFARNFISERIITNLNMIFGLCSMGMGISSIVLMENMPAVIFALILGTGIGLAIHLGDKIRAGALMMEKASSKIVKSSPSALDRKEFTETLITIIVIFVASGTGIYGSIVSGMTGDLLLYPWQCCFIDRDSAVYPVYDIISSGRCHLSSDNPCDDQ